MTEAKNRLVERYSVVEVKRKKSEVRGKYGGSVIERSPPMGAEQKQYEKSRRRVAAGSLSGRGAGANLRDR